MTSDDIGGGETGWISTPQSPSDKACFEPGITTFPVEGGFEVSVNGRRREGVWPTWEAAMEAAVQIERADQRA